MDIIFTNYDKRFLFYVAKVIHGLFGMDFNYKYIGCLYT